MPKGKQEKPIEFYVSFAEKLANEDGEGLPRVSDLMRDGLFDLVFHMKRQPKAFAHIPRKPKSMKKEAPKQKVPAKPPETHLELADRLARENGGKLPTNTELIAMGYGALVKAIVKDREPFEHLLPKLGRGRPKEKYELFMQNIDMNPGDLAKLIGVSRTTVDNWRKELHKEQGLPIPGSKPVDASLSEIARFIESNLPDDWSVEIGFSRDGIYVAMVTPTGSRPTFSEFDGMDVFASIVAHVNFARKREGMNPVKWEVQ